MAGKIFEIPLAHEDFGSRKNGAETLKIVSNATGASVFSSTSLSYKTDEKEQLSPSNTISSVSEHRVSDGQKRYRTLGETTSSAYPRPKTLFKVFFEPNEKILSDSTCLELSDFVINVDKPTITYTTKQMNQYNRIKYVYDNIKYGELKITFIDVKDNPIQKAFFDYMRFNNNDFPKESEKETDDKYRSYYESTKKYYSNDEPKSWGLNINSNEKMFKRIFICEMFLNRIMVYTIENPTFKTINFGSNKMGDYGYNEIIATFDVEGITNVFEHEYSLESDTIYQLDMIGKSIARHGGADLAHSLGMRWIGTNDIEGNSGDNGGDMLQPTINKMDSIIQQKEISDEKILKAQNQEQLKIAKERAIAQQNYTNKTKYYWISDGIGGTGEAVTPENFGRLFTPRSKTLISNFLY